jgi:hypothetical protein
MIYQYNDCLTPGGEHLQKVSDFLIKIGIKSGTDIVVNYIRRIAPCKCFGYCVEYSKAAHAVLYMVNIINDLASMGAIKASLATIGSIELSNGNLIVFSYLNIDDNLLQIVDLKYKDTCMFEEGAIPKEFK